MNDMKTKDLYEEYKVDISAFTQERPWGVSGILRCRNCADFIEACIESCIGALDELIIVFHDCTDNTPQILQKKQAQYSTKIKIYEYRPYILPIEMNQSIFSFAEKLPFDSIHFTSGYYNYALSKVTFRYVVKVDIDQIYFPQVWKRLCDAYRSTVKVKLKVIEYIAYGFYNAYIQCFYDENINHFRLLEKMTIGLHRFYFSYIEKRIIRDKVAVSLSGINLFRLDDEWKIGLGDEHNRELFPPFNGVRDTFFFKLSEQTYYEKYVTPSDIPGNMRMIETMRYSKEILDGGFCWFHLKPIMPTQRERCNKMYEEQPDRFTTLEKLKENTYRKFRNRYHPFIAVRFAEPIFSYFYTALRKYIPWNKLKDLEKLYNVSINNEHTRRMNMRDYYLEFHEELDRRLIAFAAEQEEGNRMFLGKHNIKSPLITFLFYQLTQEKDHYNACRINGMSVNEAMKRIDAFLDMFKGHALEPKEETLVEVWQHPWYEILSDYSGQLLIYIFNAQQLQYLIPLITKLNRSVLLLSEYELPDETDLPEYVTSLPIKHSNSRAFHNAYIEHYFPFLYQYTNLFSFLLQILKPSGVICVEGCHTQEQLLAVIAQDYNIPAIGIQQGWPSFMHTGFRRLPFRYFLTWGERFSELWKKYNQDSEFLPMGYMHNAADTDIEIKDSITFFLQAPCYLNDSRYLNDMFELIADSAALYPHVSFLVREHPEYKLEKKLIKSWEACPNIQMVSDWELKEVYKRTFVVVSHFSSSLMEGIVHNCIPLVYDSTTGSRYFPDVEKEGLGRIAKTKEEFQLGLKDILTDSNNHVSKAKNPYLRKIKEQKQQWFAAAGDETLKRMVEFIQH